MRVIARNRLVAFTVRHPETASSVDRWYRIAKAASWSSTSDVQSTFSKAKVLNSDRIRFEIAGGDFRLVAAFDFARQIVFIKFVGTHAEYDRVDALTVSQF